MLTQPQTDYSTTSPMLQPKVDMEEPWRHVAPNPTAASRNITDELRRLGVSRFAMTRMASHYLPRVIHPGEQMKAVVYGHYENGHAILVATDRRVIFLDKKPLFVNQYELSYNIVGGVSFSHAGIGTSVTLYSRIKNFTIHTFNQKCATAFVHYIETRCLEQRAKEGYDD